MILWFFIVGALFVTSMFFAWRRLLSYLQYFQQEEYDAKRFLNWMWQRRAWDKNLSARLLLAWMLVLLLVVGGSLFSEPPAWILKVFLWVFFAEPVGVFLLFLWAGKQEADPRKEGKKKLVLTHRAKRMAGVALLLMAGVFIGAFACLSTWLAALIFVQFVPFSLLLSNFILSPLEAYGRRCYVKEAREKIARLDPFTIGITGSFGKTSVKHILAHVLAITTPTLATPRSVNTPLGITRIIREKLEKKHKYFLSEMGAYGIGSIARLCLLTPPKAGILTSVGHAHYERFKSLDTVAEAKNELTDAVWLAGGMMVMHYDVAQLDAVKSRKKRESKLITYGAKGDYKIADVKLDKKGLSFTLTHKKKKWKLKAPLYGKHHAENITAAFAMAHQLGVDADVIVTALKTVPQITHRLEVVEKKGQPTVIDDAYNANPSGFKSALEVLGMLKKRGGRRVLVTPGMVELGEAHHVKHADLGMLAAKHTDLVLLIQPERIPTFVEGVKKKRTKKHDLIMFKSFFEAKAWMNENLTEKDVVLLENDLPELYENKPDI